MDHCYGRGNIGVELIQYSHIGSIFLAKDKIAYSYYIFSKYIHMHD